MPGTRHTQKFKLDIITLWKLSLLGLVAHDFNLSSWKAEACESLEFKAGVVSIQS